MDTLWQDLKYAARTLRKNPGFAVVAMLALALGVGANTVIFSVINAVLLRPLAYEDSDRLVMIWGSKTEVGREAASLPDFADWREQSRSFESMAAATRKGFILTGGQEPERLIGAAVSADFFSMFRVRPVLGRGVLPEEDRPGGAKVVVLSQGLWQRHFGSDPGVVGKQLTLNGTNYSVVGIAPAQLQLPSRAELWVPLAMDPAQANRRDDFLFVAARLKSGASLEQARAEMLTITARLEQQYPASNTGWRADVVPLQEQIVGNMRPVLLVLLAGVGLVLLIACTNVANLLLARASTRERELAIRAALGAGRLRLARQLVTEAVLLSLLGGALGVLLAYWGTDFLLRMSPQDIPRIREVHVDLRVLGFAGLLSLVTGLLFGSVPAWQATKPNLDESLKEGGRSSTAGRERHRLRQLLVVAEVAFSLLLLVAAGLMIRSLRGLVNLDAGFQRENLLTLQMSLSPGKYSGDRQLANFYGQLLERVRALPGVVSATTVAPLPLSGGADFLAFAVAGRPAPAPGTMQDARTLFVGERYAETMGIPLLSGRTLQEQDISGGAPGAALGAPSGVMISQTLARRYFREQDPVGQRITIGDPQDPKAQWLTIVGVLADVKYEAEETDIYPALYLPQPQSGMALVVRTATSPLDMAATVRAAIRQLDGDLPVYNIRTMEQVLSGVLAQRRFTMLALGIFALAALGLAAVGVYGVISYSVSQRTHEIGVRLALGARPRDVLLLVVGSGLRLTAVGIGLGLMAGLGLTRFLASLLFGVSARDPLTFAGVASLLAVVALVACYLPARRAMRVDPIVALRYE
jgi:putative ABC transport system permease protein